MDCKNLNNMLNFLCTVFYRFSFDYFRVGFLIFCVVVPRSLSKEGAKKSHYISLIEGRKGKLEGSH